MSDPRIAPGTGKETTMKTDYAVAGMTCGHCASHVTEEIQTIKGVTGISVDWESGRMVIESDEKIPFDAVVEAVAEAGDYTVKEA